MGGNNDEPRIHYGGAGALSLFLGLLHLVDKFRYAVFVGPPHGPCGNGRVEEDNVLGLSFSTAGSYMSEELVGRYLQVEGFGVAEAAYPHVLGDHKNKLAD